MIQQQGFFLLKLLMLGLSCRFLLKWLLVEQFNYAVELGFYSITLLMKRIEQDINFKSNILYLRMSLKSWTNHKLNENPTVNCIL